MKQITALIRPSRLDVVKNSLLSIGVIGMTVCEAKGYGRQMGQVEVYRGNEFKIDFVSKILMIVVVDDDKVDTAIDLIVSAAKTGEIGDGKIFVTPVEKVVRIRTGESGLDAI